MDALTLRAHLEAMRDDPDPIAREHARWRLGLLDQGIGPGAPAQPVAEPPLPSLATMVSGAAAAIARTIVGVAAGAPILATEEDQAARIAACRACERYRETDARCSLCGCFTAVKITLAAEACPEGRWTATRP